MEVYGVASDRISLVDTSFHVERDEIVEVALSYDTHGGELPDLVVTTLIGPYTVTETTAGNRMVNIADARERGPAMPAATAISSLAGMAHRAGRYQSRSPEQWAEIAEESVALGSRLRSAPWRSVAIDVDGDAVPGWVIQIHHGSVLVADLVDMAFTVAALDRDASALRFIMVDAK